MSRAFVREDDMIGVEITPPPPARHRITAAGLAALHARLAAVPEQEGERERARLMALIAAADVVPAGRASTAQVAFGHRVTAIDDDGTRHVFTLVGEHEAEPAQGRISWRSPLGQALIGAAAGDTVQWRRPVGALDLDILDIDHDHA